MTRDDAVYRALLKKLEALDPLLVEAIDDCDEGLIEEFRALSIDEKIRAASQSAEALAAFRKR